MSLSAGPLTAANLTFICCLQNALQNKDFKEVGHLHNLTFHCRGHTEYGSYTDYIKKVIKVMWKDRSQDRLTNCSAAPLIYETQKVIKPYDVCQQKIALEFNFYILVWLAVFIFGVVGNFLVLTAFYRSKKLKKNTENHFVVSLAVSDLLLILFIVPIKIDYALHNFNFCSSIDICRLYLITDHVFFSASILSIFALTISRYITITKPYDYRKIINPVAAKLVVVLIWLVAIIVGIISNVDAEHNSFDGAKLHKNQCGYRHLNQIPTYVLYTVIFFLPCSVMLVLYIHLYCISKRHTQTIRFDSKRVARKCKHHPNMNRENGAPPSFTANGHHKRHRRSSSGRISFIIQQSASFLNRTIETRATRVLLLLYGSFIACWLPIIFVIFLQAGGVITTIPLGVYALLNFLTTLHSTIDPFIYGVLHRDFKSTLKKMLGISFLVYQRRGSGGKKNLSLSTYRSNLDVPSNLGTHRSSDSSFNFNSPRTPDRTEDGYPIYKDPLAGMVENPLLNKIARKDETSNNFLCVCETTQMLNRTNEYTL